MTDLRQRLDDALRDVRSGPGDLERTHRRIHLRRRRRRVGAGSIALVLTAVSTGLLWRVFGGAPGMPAAPDGGLIAFTTQSPDDRSPIVAVMGAAGGEPRLLVPGDAPDWSPDGRSIAFTRSAGDRSEIFVMNADGSELRRLTTNPEGIFDESPTWSPDGRTIVFSRSALDLSGPDPRPADRNHRDVYSVALDGSPEMQLVGGTTDDFSPEWSPDGTRLAFVRIVDPVSQGPDGQPQIWTMRADGSMVRPLTAGGSGGFRFDWAPDGAELVFDSSCSIFIVGLDDRRPRLLTIRSSGWDDDERCPFSAGWSPDGERIVFAAGPDDDHDIYVVRVDGTDLDRFARPGSSENEPSWIAPS